MKRDGNQDVSQNQTMKVRNSVIKKEKKKRIEIYFEGNWDRLNNFKLVFSEFCAQVCICPLSA